MVLGISALNKARFSGRVVTTQAFRDKGSPTIKGFASNELATMAATLNDRLVVRVDHREGVDTVDVFLDKGFRELRPRSLRPDTDSPQTRLADSLPFQFDAPQPVVPRQPKIFRWLTERNRRRAEVRNTANNQAFLGNVLAKANFLSEWERLNHYVGIPGLRVF